MSAICPKPCCSSQDNAHFVHNTKFQPCNNTNYTGLNSTEKWSSPTEIEEKNVTLEASCIECIMQCTLYFAVCTERWKQLPFGILHFALNVLCRAHYILHFSLCLDAPCAEVTGQWLRSGSKDYDQWLAPRHDYIMSTRHALNSSGDMCLVQMCRERWESGSFL